MGLFRRPGKGKSLDDEHQPLKDASGGKKDEPLPKVSADVTEKAQEVMRDNLTVMKEIVMRIRNEEGYAQSMYKDCPRLQNLLNKNPDLRPVFEDPRLVRINFETVYKEAGGILPEDEEDIKKQKKTWLMKIANSKFFKFLKVLLFFKKIISCITGSGIAAIGGCYSCCTDCCCEDALEAIEEDDGDYELGDMDPYADMDPNTQALNTAADYMEDPDVQEQMQRLLEEPENLEEAIENDVELRNLRDSNELCAELMKEPETMKILVDPDNLRALGEAPKLIELDFADPGGFVPEPDFVDIEAPPDLLDVADLNEDTPGLQTYDTNPSDIADLMDFDSPEVDLEAGLDADMDVEAEADMDAEPEADGDGKGDAEGEDDDDDGGGGWEEDIELENQDVDGDGDGKDAEAAQKKQKKKKTEAQKLAEAEATKKGGIAGMAASLGVAATDVIASQIVGQVFGDLSLGGGMDGPDLSALENANDMVDEDVMDVAEDTVDDVNDEKKDAKKQKKEDEKDKKKQEFAESLHDTTGKRIAGKVTAYGQIKEESDEDDDSFSSFNSDDEFADENASKDSHSVASEDEKKQKKKLGKSMKKVKKTGKGAFGALKDIAAATLTTAKETVASEFLGDDFGEMLVEKQEEMGDDDDEKKKKKKKKKKDALGGSSHHGGSAHSRGTSSKGGGSSHSRSASGKAGGSSHSRGGSSKDGSSKGGSVA